MSESVKIINPKIDIGIHSDEIPKYVNDCIVKTLAGLTTSERPLFLKMPFNGPAALWVPFFSIAPSQYPSNSTGPLSDVIIINVLSYTFAIFNSSTNLDELDILSQRLTIKP